MRKILCTVLALVMALSCFAVMGTTFASAANDTANECLVGIIGDADNDNSVTVKDATEIQKCLADLLMLNSYEELLADVDANEAVNIKDATNIQKHLVQLDTQCKIGEKLYAVLDFVGTVIMDAISQIEIEFDEDGNVTNIVAGNLDAMKIKSEFEALIGMSCEQAMDSLVSAMAEKGFFGGFVDGEKEVVILQVSSSSQAPFEGFAKEISNCAKKAADRHHCKPEFVGIDKDDYCTSYDEAYITLEKAQEIALTYAGVWAQDAEFIESEYDFEKGRHIYELEFIANGFKFECDVNAKTGKICDFEKSPIRDHKPSTPDQKPLPPATYDEFITLREAMEIALAHAGVAFEDARFEDRDFDVEDGTPYYELEFTAGGYEYEYDIHAVTGAILNVEFEPEDDNHCPEKPGKPSFSTPDEMISEEKAIEIALSAAKITTGDEIKVEVELEKSHRSFIYEVEIETAEGEFEIEIDAFTGSIVGFDCEFEKGHHHENMPQDRPDFDDDNRIPEFENIPDFGCDDHRPIYYRTDSQPKNLYFI
ncbi:MAG: PepSY domain-containing protein [Eubacteriales bacterium]|nr:PepSY domain-containing protein [Eubacteriales bacterium]